jgi:hypothetical protein
MSFPSAFGRGRDGSSSGHGYKDIHIGDDAKAHLGDSYHFRAHAFDASLEPRADYKFQNETARSAAYHTLKMHPSTRMPNSTTLHASTTPVSMSFERSTSGLEEKTTVASSG